MAKGRIEQEIVVKVLGGKEVVELEKQIKALEKAKADIVVAVDVDDKDATKKLEAIDKQIAELKGEKAEIEVTAKVDRAIDALDDVATEAKQAEAAAEALSVALGPDLAGKADVDNIIADFQRMDLSLEDIIANADRLGGKLRQLDTSTTGGIEAAMRRTRTSVDDLGRSAGSSRSALANMVGNSAQDVGQLGGISGSTGVLIGQMAEYMADASFEGDKFRNVIKNFAAIAGPAAALGVVIATVTGYMQRQAEEAEAAKKRTEELGKAMQDTADDAVGVAESLKASADALRDFDAGEQLLGDIGDNLNDMGRSIPLLGRLFQDTSVDVVDAMADAGLSIYDFAAAVSGTEDERNAFLQLLKDFRDAAFITSDQYNGLVAATNDYAASTDRARQAQGLMNVDLDEANALLGELVTKERPLEQYTDQWNTLMSDLRDGTVDTEAAADAINTLAEKLGLDPNEVISLALGEIERQADFTTEAVKSYIDAMRDALVAQQEMANAAAISLDEAQQSLNDMGSSFNDMARRESAIQDAFDLGNAPLEAQEAIVDINEAIRDLGEFIRDEGVPDILDPNDIDAQPYLAKIRGLRVPIQEAVAGAFATGGPAAATATANAYVTQIVDSLHGKLTTAEVQELLGLTDIEAVVKVAVDQESLAEAEQLLETLTGLRGQTPWSAEIDLALASGQLSPQAAQILIARELEGIGIDVPATMLPPDAASRNAAIAEANRWAAMPGHEVDMQASVNDPSIRSLIAARNAGQDDADKMPIHYPSVIDPPRRRNLFRPFPGIFDGGGTVGPAGGIAAERGPEILNDRYLALGPTYVPPGTKVTSRRRTAVIYRHGLKRYDSGGIVGGVPNVTVNFNGVGNIGNRSDMDRNVRRSLQRIERIYGTR